MECVLVRQSVLTPTPMIHVFSSWPPTVLHCEVQDPFFHLAEGHDTRARLSVSGDATGHLFFRNPEEFLDMRIREPSLSWMPPIGTAFKALKRDYGPTEFCVSPRHDEKKAAPVPFLPSASAGRTPSAFRS
jgi:hypothetical protein